MRKFKFRLDTVLRHREILETLKEQEFEAAQGRLLALEARIEHLREEFRQTVARRPGNIVGEQIDPGKILDRERYLETLLASIAQLLRHVETARVVANEMRRELVAARQAREAVSHLRDNALDEHTLQSHRIEQNVLDDLATIKHVQLMRAAHLAGLSLEVPYIDITSIEEVV